MHTLPPEDLVTFARCPQGESHFGGWRQALTARPACRGGGGPGCGEAGHSRLVLGRGGQGRAGLAASHPPPAPLVSPLGGCGRAPRGSCQRPAQGSAPARTATARQPPIREAEAPRGAPAWRGGRRRVRAQQRAPSAREAGRAPRYRARRWTRRHPGGSRALGLRTQRNRTPAALPRPSGATHSRGRGRGPLPGLRGRLLRAGVRG